MSRCWRGPGPFRAPRTLAAAVRVVRVGIVDSVRVPWQRALRARGLIWIVSRNLFTAEQVNLVVDVAKIGGNAQAGVRITPLVAAVFTGTWASYEYCRYYAMPRPAACSLHVRTHSSVLARPASSSSSSSIISMATPRRLTLHLRGVPRRATGGAQAAGAERRLRARRTARLVRTRGTALVQANALFATRPHALDTRGAQHAELRAGLTRGISQRLASFLSDALLAAYAERGPPMGWVCAVWLTILIIGLVCIP